MTESHEDDRIDAYLWDPAAPPAPDVQELERRLAPVRLTHTETPRTWTARAQPLPSRRRWLIGLAAAAVVILSIGWITAQWRWSWPSGRAWTVESAAAAVPGEMNVGSALTLSARQYADVRIARIGTMRVEGDAQVTLQSTQGVRHRLRLERGTVRVRVWAPPSSVVFGTPAGEVIDLGCEFDLTAEPDRSVVSVRSGWVQLENGIAETLVPAGARSEMRINRAPTVPVFEDADPRFISAVRALEDPAVGDHTAALTAIQSFARQRDVLTLLMLVIRHVPGTDQLAVRAAELWPPPSGVTVNGVVRGDRDGLWRWRDTLPLPPPKGWLRNWRDALPEWLVDRER